MATNIGVKLGIDGENEYRKALKDIASQTKTLDKQLAATASSFDANADSMAQNAKETELLQKKAEKLTDEIEMMKNMVEQAAEIYGESSTQCQSWEQALADAERELNTTNAAIEEHQEAAEEAQSALGQLTSEIASQSDELDTLRDAYINAVLEFGEGSDEAQALADEIVNLNSALQENQAELDAATASADALTSSMGEASEATSGIGDAANEALGVFSPAMAGIVTAAASGDLLGAIGGVASAIGDIVQGAIDIQNEFDEAEATIAVGTGLMGEELDAITTRATAMWAAIRDEDFSQNDAASIIAALNTRLGLTEEDAEAAGVAVAQFATTTGVDGYTAVNDLVDIMKLWGLQSSDNETNISTMTSLMDMFTQAQTLSDTSVTTMMSSLISQAGAMDSLGLSLEDAVGFLTAYRDAGGQTTDATSALQKASTELAEVTDDVPGAWDLVVEALKNCDGTTSSTQETIEGLGLTLEDVFGARKAGKIAQVFSESQVDVEGFTDKVSNCDGTLTNLYEASRTTKDEISQVGKGMKIVGENALSSGQDFLTLGLDMAATATSGEKSSNTIINSMQTFCDAFFESLAESTNKVDTDTSESFDNISSSAESGFSAVNDSAERSMNQMANNVDGSLSDVSTGISSAQRSWANTIGSTIYGPQITAPTITYTKTSNGSMIPSATYHTYARAYGHALELNSPTIFGAMGNSLLMGGDKAGTEVVVGENHLMGMFNDALNNTGYAGNGGIGGIENLLKQYLPQIGQQGIYLDGDVLVGSTVNRFNEALADLSVSTARGGY